MRDSADNTYHQFKWSKNGVGVNSRYEKMITWGGRKDDLIVGDQFGNKGNMLGKDMIHGAQGDDTIRGGRRADTLWGDAGHDHIFGGKGHDSMAGGRGNDQLSSNKGKDILYGGDGHDYLSGGSGKDSLFGGNGRDIFEVKSNKGHAIIVDFSIGEDKILLADGTKDFSMKDNKVNVRLFQGNDLIGVVEDAAGLLTLEGDTLI